MFENITNNLHMINPDVEIIAEDIVSNVTSLVRCKYCNYTWETLTSTLTSKKLKCRLCGGKSKTLENKPPTRVMQTQKEIEKRVREINPNLELISPYKGCKEKITVRCKLDGYERTLTIRTLKSSPDCPECDEYGIKRRKSKKYLSHEEFVKRLKARNPNLEVLTQYTGSRDKITIRCKLDSTVRTVTAYSVMTMSRCPTCDTRDRVPKAVNTIEELATVLGRLNPNYELISQSLDTEGRVTVRCKIDGEERTCKSITLLRNPLCKKCIEEYNRCD